MTGSRLKLWTCLILLGVMAPSGPQMLWGAEEPHLEHSDRTKRERTQTPLEAESVFPASKRQKLTIYDPKYNLTFRMIFAEETKESQARAIDFLNTILDRKDDDQITDIQISSESITPLTPLDKSVIFDMRCQTRAGETFIVEMQKGSMGGTSGLRFPNRMIYYAASELAQQGRRIKKSKFLRKEPSSSRSKIFYDALLPVHVVSLLNYIEFKEKDDLITHWKVMDQKTNTQSTDLLSWTFVELPRFEKSEDDLENHLERWLYFLTRTNNETIELNDKTVGSTESPLITAYQRMACLTEKEQRILDREEKTQHDSEAYYASAEERGIEKGIEKGVTQGQYQIAERMHKRGKALDEISEDTGISLEELKKHFEGR